LNAVVQSCSGLPLQAGYYSGKSLAAAVRKTLSNGHYDVVHASLPRVLPAVIDVCDVPVYVDLMDAFSLSLRRRAETAHLLVRWLYRVEGDRMHSLERLACGRFTGIAVTSRADQAHLAMPNVSLLPQGVDTVEFRYGAERRASGTVIMTGNMGYGPNVDAACWFANSVWPRVVAEAPTMRFLIAGARPGRRVRALQGRKGIDVLGPVDSMATVLSTAEMAVCPMRTGSGIQTKLLEAMATGTPAIATSTGNAGVEGRPSRDLLVADSPEDFARSIIALSRDPALRATLSIAGRKHVEERFSWAAHARALESEYMRVVDCVDSARRGEVAVS
jgi:glycosyltransferase involved in cell wall biosynthesis